MNHSSWSDKELIKGIRAGGYQRNKAFEHMYKDWRPYYLKAIFNLGGKETDVDEIISNVILNVERQVLKPDFHLHSANLIQYFTISLTNAWKKYINSKDFPHQSLDAVAYHLEDTNEWVYKEIKEHLNHMLSLLGDSCKKILTMWSERYSMIEIAAVMNYASEQTAKNAKSDCFKKLVKSAPNYEK